MRAFSRLLACLIVAASLLAAAPANAAEPVAPLPDDFLWGVSSSGFQSEGSNPDSNWLRYSQEKEPVGNAVDFRHRYAEDIALAAAMGVEVYRFGIEWARVEPAPGEWDATELAYYDDVVAHITAAGMTPMITLNHWVHPGWVADQGGWKSDETLEDFTAYSERIVARYADSGAMWVTFNEATLYVYQEIDNGAATWFDAPWIFDRLAKAHNAAYDQIHAANPAAMVTSNLAFIPLSPWLFDAAFIDKIRNRLDFVGIDYYLGLSLDNLTAARALTGELADAQPDGIYYALRYYGGKFPDLPLYIVENGMATHDNAERPDGLSRTEFIEDHVYWIQRAAQDGIDVIGYNYWSLTDNYEWGSYTPRFGLYTVDALADPDLERRATDGVAAYTAVIADGGVPADYEPVVRASVCSLIDPPLSCLVPAS
ncbi:glycoside hydrolase family 1 protein [Glycomyces niveus]|uniref:beta-glucosidase n=1 Tax=Glycomyces niveus TaxID=2820287 RepID=A0ABS3UAX9_9ACTN|nr:family 1 glycosylhydrolase [Glycomyces sp. NEAU-S30]MBO3734928.1 glycoside hydrolase family 1 protein [Glycomyces sp. NEAU-S30]